MTNSLHVFTQNNKIKIAQFGYTDGYPESAGVLVLTQLKSVSLETLYDRVSKIQSITEKSPEFIELFEKYKTEELQSVNRYYSEKSALRNAYEYTQAKFGLYSSVNIISDLIRNKWNKTILVEDLKIAKENADAIYWVDFDNQTFYVKYKTYKDGDEIVYEKTYDLYNLPNLTEFYKDFDLL
jgi:hypothetical protein